MIILDVEQGTQEWLDARLGIPTASEISPLLVKGTTLPPFGQGAMTLADTLVAERFMGVSSNNFTGNAHTELGHELEPIIANHYANCGYTDEPIYKAGIILNKGIGASPDRLIGENGGLEIKSKNAKDLMKLLRNGKVDKPHFIQVQTTLWASEREWWDYMVYCEGMPPFYKRYYPDPKTQDLLSERVPMFLELVDELEQALIDGVMPDKFKV